MQRNGQHIYIYIYIHTQTHTHTHTYTSRDATSTHLHLYPTDRSTDRQTICVPMMTTFYIHFSSIEDSSHCQYILYKPIIIIIIYSNLEVAEVSMDPINYIFALVLTRHISGPTPLRRRNPTEKGWILKGIRTPLVSTATENAPLIEATTMNDGVP